MRIESFGEHVRIETPDEIGAAAGEGANANAPAAAHVATRVATHVATRAASHVATLVLDRPARRNAIDREVAEALAAAFARFESNDAWRAGVLWGAGGTFCAGADLTALDDDARRNVIHADGSGPGPLGPTRMALAKPVIAAVAGHAVAGGLELALLCDLRVVEEDAVLGVFCRRVGVPLIDGGTVRLPRLIGLSRALDLILTGRAVTAHEALAFGLANRVVGRGEARAAAERLAAQLAAFPQAALRADRQSAIENSALADFAEALRREGAGGYRAVLDEGIANARRFAQGAGRHGGPLDAADD
ncbi:crotonase/enoyl-CoA hydratase family protein [Paraburkholderia acidisoli]|uniref:Crotonase/enoyl-CoA hydratase family protein n=1 Tax=Paraburkholderia acidisoli TaxID=2571748 RepID=A0A7Z2GFB3_9BURK|nr:crotonase/enoyl-CoA hydratase family protein [Paraburkholderia acidisoli]QGZ60736.1 crotonase/enoyl-CoA hydratase family protein [Paraburkholderia acidisoli]